MTTRGKSSSTLAYARGSGLSVKESAKQAGISERSAYRRLAEAQTAEEIAAVSTELDRVTLQGFLGMRKRALEVIAAGLESPEEATRLRTARMILDYADRMHERSVLLPEVYRLRELMSKREIQCGGGTSGTG